MKKGRYISYIILTAVTLAITAMTIGASFSKPEMATGFWFSPVMNSIVFGTLAIASLVGIFFIKPGFSIYKVSFYLFHVGITLFLAGMFMFALWGSEVTVALPAGTHRIVERDAAGNITKNEYDFLPGVNITAHGNVIDVFDFGFFMRIGDQQGDVFIEKHPNGNEKQFWACIEFAEKDQDGKPANITEKWISMNNPVRKNGVKIYLMSIKGVTLYNDGSTSGEVLLHFKKDPGEIVSVVGIVLLLAGLVGMCIFTPIAVAVRTRNSGPSIKEIEEMSNKLYLGGITEKKQRPQKSQVLNCPQCKALNRLYPDVENRCAQCNALLDFPEKGGGK